MHRTVFKPSGRALPIEVIARVFSHLEPIALPARAWHYPKAYAPLLICRSLLEPARKALFRHLAVLRVETPSFSRLYVERPAAAAYVRKFFSMRWDATTTELAKTCHQITALYVSHDVLAAIAATARQAGPILGQLRHLELVWSLEP